MEIRLTTRRMISILSEAYKKGLDDSKAGRVLHIQETARGILMNHLEQDDDSTITQIS